MTVNFTVPRSQTEPCSHVFSSKSLSVRQMCQVSKETHCIEERNAEERSIQSGGQKKRSFTVLSLCLIASS